MEKITCKICSWFWNKEPIDKHPELCHKCGFDNQKEMFNFTEFNKWTEKYYNSK